MNIERDKFLCEQMGWTECQGCQGKEPDYGWRDIENFSTWEGFGRLFEFCQKQEWKKEFFERLDYWHDDLNDIINPNRFADAVYAYLKEQK